MATATLTTVDVTTGNKSNCWKCNGSGFLPHFASIDSGRCWACNATGWIKDGENRSRDGVHTFVVDGIVWQFESIHHFNLDPGRGGDGANVRITPKAVGIAKRVDSVMFQAFALGADKRRGVTLLRVRCVPRIGRDIWRFAQAGGKPEDVTDEMLTNTQAECVAAGWHWQGSGYPARVSTGLSRNLKGVVLL